MRRPLAVLLILLLAAAPAWCGSDDGPGAKPAEPPAADPKGADPRASGPKAVDPKAVDPKAVDPKAVEPKAVEPKAPGAGRAPRRAPEPLPETPRTGSLRALQRGLVELAKRITKAVEDAKRDADENMVDLYLSYGPNELKNRKRAVRAKDLVAIYVDPTNAATLRQRAQEALAGGTLRGDIELSATSTRRGMPERSLFCRSDVVEHLKNDDAEARRLTHELLMRWYRVARNVAAILGYKPDDKKTWSRAISAWLKELKKQ